MPRALPGKIRLQIGHILAKKIFPNKAQILPSMFKWSDFFWDISRGFANFNQFFLFLWWSSDLANLELDGGKMTRLVTVQPASPQDE